MMSTRKPAVKTTATPNELRIAAILRNHKTHIEALEQRIKELQAPKRTWLGHVRRWSGVAALVLAVVALGSAAHNKPREIRKATQADIDELLSTGNAAAQYQVQRALTEPNSPYDTAKVNHAGVAVGRLRYAGTWEQLTDAPYPAPVRSNKKRGLLPVATPKAVKSGPAVGSSTPGQPASSGVAEAPPSAPAVTAGVPVPDPAGATP